ncbi:hypothetical protein IQ05_03041 [Flavobacterium tiangeerense]|uniref:Lipoprotein n=1 Tax=Flavobacterium tiangeerense TaxID=459471 RepID=A0ABY3FK40_9FLAO|nr:hypothetical protein [Flavobacterium tiangeerense]TWH99700.1 hypothetical protein IQ05_03041 [Flavobacterium tiangeerense]
MIKNIISTLFILTLATIISCKNEKNEQKKNENVSVQTNDNFPKTNQQGKDTIIEKKEKLNNNSIYNSKFIEIKNSLINGHKVILLKNEFDAIYKKNDSLKTTLWECGSPFEWLDKEWMVKTYGVENKEKGTFDRFNGEITTIYDKNIKFTTNNHIVLFDMAFAKNNSFKIISHNITLDKNTTLKEFKKIFPKIEIENLENPNNVRARFYLGKVEDDAFLFYFKNGKLDYFTLWWLLC